MNLTGRPFIGLLATVAVVLCAGVVLLWPRLAGTGVRPVLGRVGLLLGAQLAILATVGATANAYFGFYTSWNELLGIGPRTYVITQQPSAGGAPAALVAPRATETPPGGGRYVTATVRGELSGLSESASVYVPPARGRLHGILVLTDDPAAGTPAWFAAAQTALARSRANPAVLVVMRPASGAGAPCVDVPSGPQAATFLGVDVPHAIGAAYGVGGGPGAWAVAGDGQGGYCALKLAMTHSDVFSASAVVSGSYQPAGATPSAYGGSPAIRDENDLLWRIHNLPAPPVTVLFGADAPSPGPPPASAFVAAVHPPMRAVLLPPADGASLAAVLPRLAAGLAAGGRG